MKTMMQDSKRRGRPPKARPEAEQVFPSLHRNSSGVPSPAPTDESLPAVNCSDCPHRDRAVKKCYGVTRNAAKVDGVEVEKYYSCHRIGRIINPLPEWLEKEPAKPYAGPVFKVASDLPLPQPEVIDARHKVTNEAGSVHETPIHVQAEPKVVHEEPAIVQAAVIEDPAKEAGMLSRVLEDLGYQRALAEEQVDTLKSSLEAAHEVLGVIDRAIQALEAVRTLQSLTAARGD